MPEKFFHANRDLQATLEHILETTWDAFPQLAPNQIAITWIPYEPPYRINTGGALSAEAFWQYRPEGASYRGVELIYPASVVTLFYMVAMQVWLEQGMVQSSPEIERALTDMMVDENHHATSYVLDVLSGTTSGPELPPGPFETWKYQRNIVNRYFHQLGWPELRAVNMNQKIWDQKIWNQKIWEDPARCDRSVDDLHHLPYGREHEFLGKTFENRNRLTTEATARLLHSIIGGVSVSGTRSQTMMTWLDKSPAPHDQPPPLKHQRSGLIGAGLPSTAKIWSKTGITARVRHDAAYIEAEGCHPYQLIVFTEGSPATLNGPSKDIIPFISEQIFAASQAAFVPSVQPSNTP